MAQTKRKTKKVAVPKTRRKAVKSHRSASAPKSHHRSHRGAKKLSSSMIWALVRANWAPAILGIIAILIVGIWASSKGRNRPSEHSSAGEKTAGFLAKEFAAATEYSLGERMQYWSSYLATYPTVLDEIAQWVEVPRNSDIAPWVPKKFDCTTYVEVVASLARSSGVQDFYREVATIRYLDGEPGYFTRNHFPEADWIPNNAEAGVLKDVTAKVAAAAAVDSRFVEKTIRKDSWFASQRQRKEMRGLASAVPKSWEKPIHAKVQYIPLESIEKVIEHIPSGAVINLVRKSDERRPVLISHQGIFVREGKQAFFQHSTTNGHRTATKPYFRHSTVKGEIERVDFVGYLKNQHQKNWPLVGVNILEILEN